MWSWYLAGRVLSLLMLVPESGLLSDITYIARSLAESGQARALPEYPWPAVALLEVPLRLGVASGIQYYLALVAMFVAADAAFAWHLWRASERRMTPGIVSWLLLAPVLGPLVLTRFDGLVAALAASAILSLAAARPGRAGAFAALGIGIKLWPVLGVPALLLPGGWRERLPVILGVTVTGSVLAGATVLSAGIERLWSPLAFQATRGLHVESLPALPFLWARHFLTEAWQTLPGECKCYELHGPGVEIAQQFATAALLLGLAGLALIHIRALTAPAAARTAELVARITVLAAIVWIATNKVFSPQYLLWIAAPLSALGAMPGARASRADFAIFILACALTHLVVPLNYAALSSAENSKLWVLAALTLRDIALVSLGARLAAQLWRSTARGPA